MNKKELLKILEGVSDTAAIAVGAPTRPVARRLWESNIVHHRCIIQRNLEGVPVHEVVVLYSYDPHYTTDID